MDITFFHVVGLDLFLSRLLSGLSRPDNFFCLKEIISADFAFQMY